MQNQILKQNFSCLKFYFHHQEPSTDRLGDRRNAGGGGRGRLQQTAGRQDRVPLSALQVRPQELLQSAGHRDPGRVQDDCRKRIRDNKPCISGSGKPYWPRSKVNKVDEDEQEEEPQVQSAMREKKHLFQ